MNEQKQIELYTLDLDGATNELVIRHGYHVGAGNGDAVNTPMGEKRTSIRIDRVVSRFPNTDRGARDAARELRRLTAELYPRSK